MNEVCVAAPFLPGLVTCTMLLNDDPQLLLASPDANIQIAVVFVCGTVLRSIYSTLQGRVLNASHLSAVTRVSNLVGGNSVPFLFGIGKKHF